MSVLLLCSCGGLFQPELPSGVSMTVETDSSLSHYTESTVYGYVFFNGYLDDVSSSMLEKDLTVTLKWGQDKNSLDKTVKASLGDSYMHFSKLIFPFTVKITGLEDGANYYYSAIASYGKSISSPTDVVRLLTLPKGPVDLDLPSGTLWASHNLGAESAEESGDFYAWGETEIKKANGLYNWTNYLWCDGAYDKLTKYCSRSWFGKNGFVDNLTVLEHNDDPVIKKLGGKWRTPSVQEWNELVEKCQWQYVTYNGVGGWCVRSKKNTDDNKKVIFLPNTGYKDGAAYKESDNRGIYWTTNSCDGLYSEHAYTFSFFSGGYGISSASRCLGIAFRPIYVN